MINNPESEAPRRNWLYIISPCLIAAGLATVGIIISYLNMERSGGWSYLGILIGIPFLVGMLVVDVILKLIIRKQALLVWVIEGAIILAIIFYLTHL